jgi:DNA primase
MGSSATRAQIRRILSTELPVYVLFDGDEAGRDGATKLSSVLRRAGASVKVIELPDGEDPGSMSIEMAERIKEVIDDADVEIPPMFR